MIQLPAETVIKIGFGRFNVMLTVAMIWQIRNFHRKTGGLLGALLLLLTSWLLARFSDIEAGHHCSVRHTPRSTQQPIATSFVKAWPKGKPNHRTTV